MIAFSKQTLQTYLDESLSAEVQVIFERAESSTVGDHHLGHDISAAPEGIAFSRGWEMDDVGIRWG